MATPRRPSLINRAMSTPPATPIAMATATLQNKGQAKGLVPSVLTPPTSPRQSRSSSNLSNSAFSPDQRYDDLSVDTATRKSGLESGGNKHADQDEAVKDVLLECPFDVQVVKDHRGRDQVFGYGAWSTVYRATTHLKSISSQGLATPPMSPVISTPVLVAVKKPARRDARSILESEARIWSYLSTVADSEQYIVPFYGAFTSDWSLVLAAIPLSLDDHIKRCAAGAKQDLTTWNMTQPIIGSSKSWLQLAHSLVSALSWLHNEAEVVHGDVKPGNILLLARDSIDSEFPFQPLFIDFSSSQRLNAAETAANTLSAVTREYTAPELLSSAVLRDPKYAATPASDVFSTAVTLLVAATGDTMVYPGSVFQRQAMATQGWQVLNLVRSGDQGSRVPRHGVVERTLEKAVLKAGMGRIASDDWVDLVDAISKGEPSKL